MSLLERFHTLVEIDSEALWRQELFRIGKDLGFDCSLLAIMPKPGMSFEEAFICTNYPNEWMQTYAKEKMAYVDPTISHSVSRTTSLIWSPDIFLNTAQKHLYEEASGHGLRSGLTLPIHGPKGELGILCFANDRQPGKAFERDLAEQLPAFSLLRDVVFDSGIDFALPGHPIELIPSLTPRELECLQWTASGKTSWEIAKILNCSEATANFHITNFRRKLDVGSRREAVVKVLRLGLISLS